MNDFRTILGWCVVGVAVGLTLGMGGLSLNPALAGDLEPPDSAIIGGNPLPTTQTRPAWDRRLPASHRFVVVPDFGGEAVLDLHTMLVWETAPGDTFPDGVIDADDKVGENHAKQHCLEQADGRVLGWRLPSLFELLSLVDPLNTEGNPDLTPGHPFINIQASEYWSMTRDIDNPLRTWTVTFLSGRWSIEGTPGVAFVWCVRGPGGLSEY